MKAEVKHWTDTSDYDLETAKAMLLTSRYQYVGLMCHQSIEKIFKAYWCNRLENIPLKIHCLSKLAARVNLNANLSEKQMKFINNLEPMNIEARYPSYKEDHPKEYNKATCEHLIKETIELQQWIKEVIHTEKNKSSEEKHAPLRFIYLYSDYYRTIYSADNIVSFYPEDNILQFIHRHKMDFFSKPP
ncbi:MAG: HEPN domain-containing protein [Bacteroidales bacterium]